MDKNDLIETVKAMVAAPSCCQELQAAGKNWLNALGTSGEKAAAEALLAEIKDDVAPIAHTVEFFESPLAVQIFGAEKAKVMAPTPARYRRRAPNGVMVPPVPPG